MNDVVLDLGCGVGIELNAVSVHTKYLVGLDIDLSNLRIARNFLDKKSEKMNLVRAGIFFLPFRDSSFSKVLCFDVLEHLANPKRSIKGIRGVMF